MVDPKDSVHASYPLTPKCPECRESLMSHAGRGHKYFHYHVAYGPYPSDKPHICSLVDCAFEGDGSVIEGSAESRLFLCRILHGEEVQPTPHCDKVLE